MASTDAILLTNNLKDPKLGLSKTEVLWILSY